MTNNFFKYLFQDWKVNKGNPKGRMYLLLFRMANVCTTRKVYFYLGLPYLFIYKTLVQWLFTLEIPWNIKAGKNLRIYHGQALIINKYVVLGKNCTLRQCTTIGIKQNADGTDSGAPVIGDHVDIGSNVCVIGSIQINDYAIIGSGSVVVKSVAKGSIVAGNPAKEIIRKEPTTA